MAYLRLKYVKVFIKFEYLNEPIVDVSPFQWNEWLHLLRLVHYGGADFKLNFSPVSKL